MNATILQANYEARRRFLLTAGGSLSLVLLVLLGVYLPLKFELQQVTRTALKVREDLLPYVHLRQERALQQQFRHARALHAALLLRQDRLQSLVGTTATNRFQEVATSPGVMAEPGEESRIDFKVALYNARERLQAHARNRGVAFPSDLGMEDAILMEENAQTRLLQMAAVVRLAELAIDLGIPRIDHLAVLPPLASKHPRDASGASAREFQVLIRFQASFEIIEALLKAVHQPGRFMALRRIELVKSPRGAVPLVHVTAIFGDLLYNIPPVKPPEPPEGEEEEMGPPAERFGPFLMDEEDVW